MKASRFTDAQKAFIDSSPSGPAIITGIFQISVT
jgi:hypothetical protein